MRSITRVLLLCALAVAALPGLLLAAPAFQASVEPRGLALTPADLPVGFAAVPDRTVSEERPDGVAVYDVTYVRDRTSANLAAGAFEIRSGVARTARPEEAVQQFASTAEAFSAEGWKTVSVPKLGDEAIGLSQTTEDGGPTASNSYLFRKGSWIMMIGLRGRPDALKMDDAVALAIVVSQRLDRAASGAQSSGSPSVPASGTAATGTRAPASDRVRVTSMGGANVRAEPSTSAAILGEAPEGTILDVVGASRDADGRTWRNVRLTDGQTGWVASTLVETVAPPPGPASSPVPSAPSSSPSPAPQSAGPSATPSPAAPPSDTVTLPEGGVPVPAGDPATGAEPSVGTEPGGDPASALPASDMPATDAPMPAQDAGPSATVAPAAVPAASSAPASGSAEANVARASGPGGLAVEATLREARLTSGNQQVRVLVTRNGQPVQDARVDVKASLDPRRYVAVNAPRTGSDGRSEVEWSMADGPAGDYEVAVDVRSPDSAPPTTATAKFRWQ